MRRRHQAPSAHLTAEERQALELLHSTDGVLAVTQTLSRQGLVSVYPEFVLLTDAGRRALAEKREK